MTRRRLGLLGGSFDPIHNGHLHVARRAQAAFELDRIFFVPAARPPHKPGRRLASGADRLAMIELAIAGEPAWSACDLELARGGTSYTVDTVHQLREWAGEAPDAEIFLIVGADNLEGLLDWRSAAELFERVQPIVIPRAGVPVPDLDGLLRGRPAAWGRKLRSGLLDFPPAAGSSTDLRLALERGDDPGEDLPRGVREYISTRGLYRDA